MQLRVTVWISALCILAVQKTPPVILPLWPVLYQLPPSLHTPCGTVKSQTHQWTIIDEMDLLWPWAFIITWKMLKGIAMKSWSSKQMATRSILSLAERRTFHPELPENDFLGHWNFHSNIQQYQANKVGRFYWFHREGVLEHLETAKEVCWEWKNYNLPGVAEYRGFDSFLIAIQWCHTICYFRKCRLVVFTVLTREKQSPQPFNVRALLSPPRKHHPYCLSPFVIHLVF